MALSEEFVSEITSAIDAETASGDGESDPVVAEGSELTGDTVVLDSADAEPIDEEGDGDGEGEADGVVSPGTEDGDGVGKPAEGIEAEQAATGVTAVVVPAVRSDDLVERAVRAGFSLGDAKAFPSDGALESACSVIETREKADDGQEEEDQLTTLLGKLNPEEFEPEALEVLTALANEVRSQRDKIGVLESGHERVQQTGRVAAEREVELWFDGQVANLGEDYVEALGSGAHAAFDQGSPQLAKREAIAQRMAVMIAGHNAVGGKVPSRETLFSDAVRTELADEFAAIDKRRLQAKLKARSGQHIARGTGAGNKGTSTVSPLDEAAALLDRKYGK